MTTLNLETLTLDKGSHRTPDEGLCLLEAAALFAGEGLTDRPSCVSRVLANFGISLNDRFGDERRQELKRFIPLLPGTAGDGQDEARGYLALDWLVRTYTPAFLDLRPELAEDAAELRGLRRIADLDAARAVGPVVRSVSDKSAAAATAARANRRAAAAARATAWDAIADAAGDAAWDAASDAAARAAARAAAWDASWAAAWDTVAGVGAWDALRLTVDQLQTSAIDLYARMIDPSAA